MKNSFVFYTDYINQIELLNMQQRGLLFTAVMYYAAGCEPPELDGITSMAFSFIRNQLDKDIEKYNRTVEARREAGKKGGRPPVKPNEANAFSENQEEAKKANAFLEKQKKQTKVKKPDNDNVNDNDNVLKENTLAGVKEKRFAPPTLENVIGYCREMGYSMDAQRFIDFYASKGWMVGKNKMKDWKAAVRNWARQDKEQAKSAQLARSSSAPNRFHNFDQSSTSYDAIMQEQLRRRMMDEETDG